MPCFITLAIVLRRGHRGAIFTLSTTGKMPEDLEMRVVAVFFDLLKVVKKNAAVVPTAFRWRVRRECHVCCLMRVSLTGGKMAPASWAKEWVVTCRGCECDHDRTGEHIPLISGEVAGVVIISCLFPGPRLHHPSRVKSVQEWGSLTDFLWWISRLSGTQHLYKLRSPSETLGARGVTDALWQSSRARRFTKEADRKLLAIRWSESLWVVSVIWGLDG